ncbi:phosphoesterase PA-phosphatase related protein [Methanohalobium evestigatum Z-7303]|uniref:Phosphoesterase PA-phosphatase related protein n=1 Tax=Methanohalobium evestigatum (strain ATCC BAA-1072 / DSM 3721 / NBRC 107634 / OCM 161 / Z-7303) TaxID=644295 RepID=D7E795_METEZ|nr:phosphatase PAP2 family protein [Methanohalobium evestigatum]ADI73844.1 phosphoesterase PA-phosphatase related protein [Methanohalobium evestigatum Z-7303]
MIFLTWIGYYPLWIILILFLYYQWGKTTAIRYILVLLSVSFIVFSLKAYLMVPRPQDVRIVLEAYGYSMPSAHASLSFASAVFLHPIAGRLKYGLWLLAILISISRISLGVHYPVDIVVGAFIGGFIGYLGYHLRPLSKSNF